MWLQHGSVGSVLNCSGGSDDVFDSSPHEEAAPPPPAAPTPAPAHSQPARGERHVHNHLAKHIGRLRSLVRDCGFVSYETFNVSLILMKARQGLHTNILQDSLT